MRTTDRETTTTTREAPLSRRRVLGTVGALALTGTAGCGMLDSSSPTPPPDTTTSGGEQTATTVPDDVEVSKAIEIARTELTAAFSKLSEYRVADGSEVRLSGERIHTYEPDPIKDHATVARAALENVAGDASGENKERITTLAKLAEYVLKKQDEYFWLFAAQLALYNHGDGVRDPDVGAKEIREVALEAMDFASRVTKIRKEALSKLDAIDEAGVEVDVDGFSVESQRTDQHAVNTATSWLYPTAAGFNGYAYAAVLTGHGKAAYDDKKYELAKEKFTKAQDAATTGGDYLNRALDRDTQYHRDTIDLILCQLPMLKQAMDYYAQAAQAKLDGDDEEAADFMAKGDEKVSEAKNNCP